MGENELGYLSLKNSVNLFNSSFEIIPTLRNCTQLLFIIDLSHPLHQLGIPIHLFFKWEVGDIRAV